jgi:cardiolipin synthase
MESFARDWTFTTGEMLEDERWWPEIAPSGIVRARGVASGPDGDIGKLEDILGAALAQARTRVRIVSPYFLPDQRLEFSIAQARLRGVKVEILLPKRSDYRLLDWAMRAHLRFFAEMPDGLYFTSVPFDHAKLMTVDGEWCLIGSSNWDARSLRLNFEFDVECYGSQITGEIDRLIDGRIAAAEPVTRAELLAAPRWVQLRDAAVRLFLPYL